MIDNCPVCENYITRIKFTHQRYEYKHCKICGTLFVANTLTAGDICSQYDENYYEAKGCSSNQRMGYDSYLALQESLIVSFEKKLEFIKQKIKSGRLLDLGCAYGTFMITASSQYDCFGVDISNFATKTARTIYRVKTVNSAIEQVPFAENQFDIITMWDVIEHLRYPVSALAEANRILRPGGFCFVGTDDVNNWLVQLMGRKWWSIAPPIHLCHFSQKSIKIAAERAGGFEVCEMVRDQRTYKINEIIKHFGNSYQNKLLIRLGILLGRHRLGQFEISIKRPEQFILVLKKQL